MSAWDVIIDRYQTTKTRMGNAALITTGVVALGSYLAFSKRGTRFEPEMVPIKPIPPMPCGRA